MSLIRHSVESSPELGLRILLPPLPKLWGTPDVVHVEFPVLAFEEAEVALVLLGDIVPDEVVSEVTLLTLKRKNGTTPPLGISRYSRNFDEMVSESLCQTPNVKTPNEKSLAVLDGLLRAAEAGSGKVHVISSPRRRPGRPGDERQSSDDVLHGSPPLSAEIRAGRRVAAMDVLVTVLARVLDCSVGGPANGRSRIASVIERTGVTRVEVTPLAEVRLLGQQQFVVIGAVWIVTIQAVLPYGRVLPKEGPSLLRVALEQSSLVQSALIIFGRLPS